MCGIAGFLSHDPRRPADLEVVRALMAQLVHRGPDDEGLRAFGPCALGHRRLSIIDLSEHARQPLLSCDGSSAVIVNGEFYDFEEIRTGLPKHRFVSSSDSEIAVHLYEEHGEDFVQKLDGMFALALWDDRKQRLMLARDRTGKKPLYTRRLPHGLAFASEIAPLAALAPKPSLRHQSIDEYLTLAYVPAPFTIYEGIFKLPAASIAALEPGGEVNPRRYYTRPESPELSGSADDLAAELRTLLEAAVKRRLRSDVPLGAFLSGGIDSSTIVALMARAGARVKTFSVGFRFGDRVDMTELRHAREVARRYDTDHTEEIVSPEVTSLLPEIVKRHGEPFGDSSALAMHMLSKVTRQHVTVALSGDGADEILAGYKRHGLARLGALHDMLPAVLRRPLASVLALVGKRSQSVRPFAATLGESEAARYLALFGNFTDSEKAGLYGDAMASVHRDATLGRFERLLGDGPLPKRLSALDVETYLSDDINTKVDIASMTFALEVRCPFLDTRVLDFTGRLPADMLMRARGKWILRRAVRDLVPSPIRHRIKRGFALPLETWMKKDLRPLVRDAFSSGALRELFRREALDDLEKSLDQPGAPVDRAWLLLVLGTWLNAYR